MDLKSRFWTNFGDIPKFQILSYDRQSGIKLKISIHTFNPMFYFFFLMSNDIEIMAQRPAAKPKKHRWRKIGFRHINVVNTHSLTLQVGSYSEVTKARGAITPNMVFFFNPIWLCPCRAHLQLEFQPNYLHSKAFNLPQFCGGICRRSGTSYGLVRVLYIAPPYACFAWQNERDASKRE